MENASKALLIAGEMLIAMLVAGVMALLFSTMSSYADEHAQKQKIQEVQAFNANITQYAKEKSTAQDIVSLVNFAKEMNKQLENDIEITIGNTSIDIENWGATDFLQNNSNKSNGAIIYYEAKINNYFDDGRIQSVKFKKI